MSSTITIVTATYDRPELLRQVIRAVRCQSIESWRWIIVGDACSAETGEMIAAFDDPRITYINLPERFGEQAGPNSVGLALANTPCVALLNHDDLWLPDHLAVGLDTLRESGGDLCITRTAFVGRRGPETAWRTVYFEQSETGRNIADIYETPAYLFEPLSSWIGTRDFFDRLGPMRLATTLDVLPIRDWTMRVAPDGGKGGGARRGDRPETKRALGPWPGRAPHGPARVADRGR